MTYTKIPECNITPEEYLNSNNHHPTHYLMGYNHMRNLINGYKPNYKGAPSEELYIQTQIVAWVDGQIGPRSNPEAIVAGVRAALATIQSIPNKILLKSLEAENALLHPLRSNNTDTMGP